MISWEAIRQRWGLFGSKLDERGRRLLAAVEARTAGRGEQAAVAEITGLAGSTIGRGLNDLDNSRSDNGRVRRKGGGSREVADLEATLVSELQSLVEPATMGVSLRRPKISSALRCTLLINSMHLRR